MEEAQRKDVVLKARLGPWLDEGYVIAATIEEKLASQQRTQQKIKEDSARPKIEQLVEQVKQASTKSTTEVEVAQVELGVLALSFGLFLLRETYLILIFSIHFPSHPSHFDVFYAYSGV